MPRSASRDRSDRFDGRRGYFRRLDGIGRAKLLLSAVAALCVLIWAVADFTFPKQTQAAHTHGELADPHAALHDNCQACHAGYVGGEKAKWGAFDANHRWREWNCGQCHKFGQKKPDGEFVSGLHHASSAEDKAKHADCGSCHHDHKGGLNRLTRVADSYCTGCHSGDIKGHPNPSGTPITAFAEDKHPQFKPLTTQPSERTMKFSHALHMSPGLAYTAGGREELTKKRMKEVFKTDRYTKPGDDDKTLVALDCKACHELEPGGRHYKPVSFEASCQTCHPLTAPSWVTDGVVVKGLDVPHRTPNGDDGRAALSGGLAAALFDRPNRAGLRGAIVAGYLDQLTADDKLFAPLPPGSTPDDKAKVREGIKAEVERVAGSSAELLWTGVCLKCHDTTFGEVTTPAAHPPWLPKAKFSHAPHQKGCADCHPGTKAAAFTVDKESVAQTILGMDKCRECHTPRTMGKPDTGVRHGCTDCHGYHHK